MRGLFILIFSVLALASLGQDAGTRTSSLVIVKFHDLDLGQWGELVTKVNASDGMVSEFYCEKSEIMVIRYYHKFTEKADVEGYILGKMKAWSRMKTCKILYVEISTESDKC